MIAFEEWLGEDGFQLLETTGAVEPVSEADARWRTLTAIARRQGDQRFRSQLLAAYGGRCALSSCNVEATLEAACIIPFRGAATWRVDNGLLLRADLHTLFDFRLITVDTSREPYRVLISPQLAGSSYAGLARLTLRLPDDPALRPSRDALEWHRQRAGF